jgi:hypothetical protein
MARRPALANPSRSVNLSNSFIFKQFRTLFRNGAITSPFSSIACALFSMQWRGRGDSLLSRLTSLPRASAKGHESPATKRASDKDASPERAQRVEGSRSSAKSCICHRSEKSPAKSFRCHTSKNALPQTLCLPHLRPPPPPGITWDSLWQTANNERCRKENREGVNGRLNTKTTKLLTDSARVDKGEGGGQNGKRLVSLAPLGANFFHSCPSGGTGRRASFRS